MGRLFFITGSDTGVGKTVLTVLLTRHLRQRGEPVLALKPLCSGGREDARALWEAQEGEMPLDEINPWHFRAPVTPWLAARREGRSVELPEVMRFLRSAMKRRFATTVLIEGAGGLLSPLGRGFSAREIIRDLRAIPLVVCVNRLGALNQALLVVDALPPAVRPQAGVVLMQPADLDRASRSNPGALAELLGPGRVFVLPRFSKGLPSIPGAVVQRLLDALTETGACSPRGLRQG